ncbi:extracellular tyrosine-protein kinase PKDCC-like [Antedon mediterranea]|uniref:extracellular tyrosine-protein kinase PKDCC-like n=1 Tax=Antedon mediterranea TaxID=105859 RepID=UPI003AF501AB
MHFRLKYRGFLTFCGIATLYIYYSMVQLTADVYYDDPYLQVKRNVARDTRTNSTINNGTNSTSDSTIVRKSLSPIKIENCTAPQHDEETTFSCSNISNIKILKSLGHGVTKEVFLGVYDDEEVAVKMVTSKVQDVRKCLQRKKYWKEQDCYLLANYKLLKEMLFMQQLHHPNILKRIGYCVRNEKTSGHVDDHGVISVAELGSQFNPGKYKRTSWERRMTTTIELLDLLDYFAHSPLGSLMMTDMKHTQFLVVNNRVKLGDMDDVTNEEQKCKTEKECYIDKIDYGIQCVNGICKGINAKFNLHFFNSKIFSLILQSGTSASIADETRRALRHGIKHPNSTALEIKQSLQQILLKYKS